MVQARIDVNRKFSLPMEDVEHSDLSVCYGLLVDTVSSTSWALYHIYSQRSLLNEPKESISPTFVSRPTLPVFSDVELALPRSSKALPRCPQRSKRPFVCNPPTHLAQRHLARRSVFFGRKIPFFWFPLLDCTITLRCGSFL